MRLRLKYGKMLSRFALKIKLRRYSKDEFLDYGTPTQDLYPGWFDVPAADKW